MPGGPRLDVLRLFVALELPEEWTQALARMQADLRARGLARLRWVRPEGIHLTLKFLGEVPAPRLAGIDAALRGAVARAPDFALRLGAPGTFGRGSPRVLWVGIEGDLDRLAALQRRVEAVLAPLGFPPEGRPFAPHLTLARVPEAAPPDLRRAVAPAVEWLRVPPAPDFRVSRVSLMESRLGPGGAVYICRGGYPATNGAG